MFALTVNALKNTYGFKNASFLTVYLSIEHSNPWKYVDVY
jgi:hypothetical protein